MTRRSSLFTVIAVVVGVAAAGVAVALAFAGERPGLLPLALLAALAIFSENSSVELPGGTSASAGLMAVTASVVVFASEGDGWALGPLLVGMCGCLYLPHLRAFEWRKMLFNFGMHGFSALAAAAAFAVLAPASATSVPVLLLMAFPVAIAFSIVNITMLAAVVALNSDRSLRQVLPELARGHVQVYPFAILGVFLGLLYRDAGPIVVPLFFAPVLIARETFQSYISLEEAQEATVRTLIGALEAKDGYTAGHAGRVAVYAQYVGEELNLNPKRLVRLRFAALMHDVGKLVVPNHLLNKPGKLTAAEYAQVRRHEEVSVAILTRIDFLAPVAPSASGEYTRYKPEHANDRPIEPYIVAVADAYDAMTSTRAYRRALSQEVAFEELRAKTGVQFHPVVVEALIGALERRGERHGAGYEAVDAAEIFRITPPEGGLGSAGLGDLAAPAPPDRASGGVA